MIKFSSNFFKFVIIANIIGVLWGIIFFYGKQLEIAIATQPWTAIFIPDSPMQTLFITLAFLFVWLESKKGSLGLDGFKFFAFAGVFKNAIWTTYVLVTFQSYYFHPEIAFTNGVLLIAHILLGLEGLILLGRMKFKYWYLLPVLVWFFASDFIDYTIGTHPPTPTAEVAGLFGITLEISVIAIFIAFLLARHFNRKIALLEFEKANLDNRQKP